MKGTPRRTVWLQPPNLFPFMKSIGINTLYGFESVSGTVSREQWVAAADAAGLGYILTPDPVDPHLDLKRKGFVGWMHPLGDEPDLKERNMSPQQVRDGYDSLKAVDEKTPIWLNFSSKPFVIPTFGQSWSQDETREGMKGADVVSTDIYPEAGWGQHTAQMKPSIPDVIDMMNDWSGGKESHMFFECSDQGLPWIPANARLVAPAPAVAGQVWSAIMHGLDHVGWFPQVHPNGGGAFIYEGISASPPMQKIITLIHSHLAFADLTGIKKAQLPAPFVGVVLKDGSWIVVNFSDQVAGYGSTKITLQPFDVVWFSPGGRRRWQYSWTIPDVYGVPPPVSPSGQKGEGGVVPVQGAPVDPDAADNKQDIAMRIDVRPDKVTLSTDEGVISTYQRIG